MWLMRRVKPPFCDTVEIWAFRNCLTNLSLYLLLFGVFIWLSTADNVIEDQSKKDISKAFCITITVITGVPAVFTLVQFYGLFRENIKVITFWLYYAYIATILHAILWIGFCIFGFTADLVIESLIILAVMALLTWFHYYCMCINYTVILNLNESSKFHQQDQETL